MQKMIEQIRLARYGKEVREPAAIVLQGVYDKLIVPVENSEVVQARGTYKTLFERMNENKRKIEVAKSEIDFINSIFGMQEGV